MTIVPRFGAGHRVLITGGAGFVGSHLTDALLARGANVVVVGTPRLIGTRINPKDGSTASAATQSMNRADWRADSVLPRSRA